MIRGRRLVLRIYLIGLAQIAALAVTLAIAREASRPQTMPHRAEMRFLLDELAAQAPDRAALDARLRDLKQSTGIEAELRDHTGAVLGSSGPVPAHGSGTFNLDWSGGKASLALPPPPRPPVPSPTRRPPLRRGTTRPSPSMFRPSPPTQQSRRAAGQPVPTSRAQCADDGLRCSADSRTGGASTRSDRPPLAWRPNNWSKRPPRSSESKLKLVARVYSRLLVAPRFGLRNTAAPALGAGHVRAM